MKKVILTFGLKNDPHTEAVRQRIEQKGGIFIVADLFSIKSDTCISINFRKDFPLLKISGDGYCVEGHEITAVWWRLKPPLDRSNLSTEEIESKMFTDREWRHAIEALEVILPHSTWMNPRYVDGKVRYKPTQLYLASQFGFDIPDTLITNDPNEVSSFLTTIGNEAIYKPLTWFFKLPDKLLFTNKISLDQVVKSQDNIKVAPGIFQKKIQKLYELRITIIGSDIHCIRIDSQSNPETLVDWRRNQFDVSYFLDKLPPNIESKLISFHQALGLVYGAYDFIVTPDSRYVFLEVNPVGQWLWLEEKTKVPISDSVANTLMNF